MLEIDRFETLFGPMFHYSDDEVIGQSLRRYGQWAIDEIALIAHIMKANGTGNFIDLGANVGAHTLAIASLFPTRRVFSFEANPRTFNLLCSNITCNGLNNVSCFNYLIGDVSAVSRVITNEAEVGKNLGAVAFQVVSLETVGGYLLLQAAVSDIYPIEQSVSFIKIDVEGMEWPALLGARAILDRHHPSIYLENGAQINAGPIFDELTELGYETFWHINFPFDADNYRGDAVNFFGGSVEIGTLCIHRENPIVDEFRRDLTHTQDAMDAKAWHQCIALNEHLRKELRAAMLPDRSMAQLRSRLLTAFATIGGSQTEPGLAELSCVIPSFGEVRRATLLDIPGDMLRPLLAPHLAAAPFDEAAYLRQNPDVAEAVAAQRIASAREHYVTVGYFEGRIS